MKTIFILFFLLSCLLFSAERPLEEYPKIYSQLSIPLFEQVNNFQALSKMPQFLGQDKIFKDYKLKVEVAIEHGKSIDATVPENAQATKAYLQELRALQSLHDKIEKSYKKQLYKSIENNKEDEFYELTSVFLPFVSSDPRLKEKVVHYYEKTSHNDLAARTDSRTITHLDDLSQDFGLDQKSYTYANTMFRTYEHNNKVEERNHLEEFIPNAHQRRSIQVISVKTDSGFDLYLENNAFYDVTVELKAVRLINLLSSEKLPFVGSFPAQNRTKILSFTIRDPYKETLFQTLYSTTVGRLNPDYDSNFLYALPYARGTSHMLTQGFNGEHTHNGTSAYALDFKMDEGTKVHAMRKGTVVSVEDTHTEHGFSSEFSAKSNYIIIQHDDGTMAMYGHLKVNGVKVKLGQKVYKHAFIGLSGNTGYSSGPHLHVHISAIKSLASGSSSVPFIFLSDKGKTDSPQVNSFYIAR